MTSFCNNCGGALPAMARFCSACGTAVPSWGYPPEMPRLVRPIFGRQFAGVCAGLSRTYGWDLGLVRILTVVGAIFLCPFVEIVYLAGWIGIPEEMLSEVPPPPHA